MSKFIPVTLSFRDRNLDRQYRRYMAKRVRVEGRTAILVGSFVYLLCGVLDEWLVPAGVRGDVWAIRLLALTVPVLVMAASFTRFFTNHAQWLLASVSLAAGVGIIAIQSLVPLESSAYIYPMLVMLTFYTYNFIGIRFIYALVVDLSLLLAYNITFGVVLDYPLEVMLAHDIIIVSSNLIGGAGGYLAELHRRTLFLHKKELEDERAYHYSRSLHDGLTGLPNREMLYDRLRQAIATGQRDGSLHCGLFLDLDGFKAVNDTLGHEVGDQVLQTIADRLKGMVREVDCVARIGGDEFFVLAMNVNTRSAAEALAEKILARVREPVVGLGSEVSLSVSIGIHLFPDSEAGAYESDIVKRADQAMYTVKSGGKNSFEFAV